MYDWNKQMGTEIYQGGTTYPKPARLRTDEDLKVLEQLCFHVTEGNKQLKMLEIGSYIGESTSVFANNFETVYAVDPWKMGMDLIEGSSFQGSFYMFPNVEIEFDRMVMLNPNIKKIKAFDYEIVDTFENQSLDFIYIDALHTKKEIQQQILKWLPKIKPTGFIGGHDYSYQFSGVIAGVYDLLGLPSLIFSDNGNSWIKKLSEPIRM